jgi:hypothetical protein
MNQLFKPALYSMLLISAISIDVSAATMSRDEYTSGKDRISSAYKTDRAKCDAQSGNAKDVCVAEAKANEKRAKAKLEMDYKNDAKHQLAYAEASADADYMVAKEKCSASSGNQKDVCMQEAKAARTKVIADAKQTRTTKDAIAEAKTDKRDADYKVAIERCDALSGPAKDQCVADAKGKFGK